MYSITRVWIELPGAGDDAGRQEEGGQEHEQHRDAVAALCGECRPENQTESSTNWKPDCERSKDATSRTDRARVASVVASAIQRAAETARGFSPLPNARSTKMAATPIRGRKVVRRGCPSSREGPEREGQQAGDPHVGAKA